MTNLEKYNKVFLTNFKGITEEDLPNLKYRAVHAWESVGHMELVSDLEEKFGVHFTTLEVLDFNTYQKGIELLRQYGIDI